MAIERKEIGSIWLKIRENDDSKAFESFFFQLSSRLIKFSVFYLHNQEAAEEIVSDVFTNLWINRKKLGHVQNVESYLYIAVKNQSLNYIKKYSNVHLVSLDDSELEFVDPWCPQKEVERRELIFLMDQAIESLPQQCKIIFRLVKEDGLKYKEVAEILNVSPKTVHTQLYRAMKKLNTVMQPYNKESNVPFFNGLSVIVFFLFNLISF